MEDKAKLKSTTVARSLSRAKKAIRKGDGTAAAAIYNAILKETPNHPIAKKALSKLSPPKAKVQELVTLYGLGKLAEVIEKTEGLLPLFPYTIGLLNILGAANAGMGRFDSAIEQYQKAIEIRPDFAEAYYNLGNALKESGELDAAIEQYQKAIEIKPGFTETYYNMGNALQTKGELGAAIEQYQKVIKDKPDFAEAYNNMGNALKENGELDAAIEQYQKAIEIKPDFAESYCNIGNALVDIVFNKPVLGLSEIILKLLEKETYVRPSEISRSVISLLKFDLFVNGILEKCSLNELEQSLQEVLQGLSNVKLLLKLLSVCPIPDLEFEALFTNIRAAVLFSVPNLSDSKEILPIHTALALQCFTNEYVYIQSDAETKSLETLENDVAKMLSLGLQPHPIAIACLASYKALNEYPWNHLISKTGDLEIVVERQILEVKEEEKLRAYIPVFKEISGSISSKVRAQYEESPYPSGANLSLNRSPRQSSLILKESYLRVPDEQIHNCDTPEILIAGCGTGQQSIETASRFSNSKVLAVDLSLNSLAYAKRKTEELGLDNIEYLQADILDLCRLNRQFDIIESVGVLHHMEDPMAGWKVLMGCLKPGGLIKIGLYSELARQPMIKLRNEISDAGIGSSSSEIRDFRTTCSHSKLIHHKNILTFSDFYSLSEVRDLLFHVQEHRFTIPKIKQCLGMLDLAFCGFEISNRDVIHNFRSSNPNFDDLYDLDIWQVFEEEYPDVFTGMYQFWCQNQIR